MTILPIALFSAFNIFLGSRLMRRGVGSEGAEIWLGLFFLCGGAIEQGAEWTLQVIRLSVLTLGPAVIASLWLAFFPPERYSRWLVERSSA